MISLLCCYFTAGYAQVNDVQSAERQQVRERAQAIYQQTHGNMGASARMNYKSSYSQVHAAYPDAPANAVPAYPSAGDYTALQDPPCYRYKNTRGHEVMECPGARFAPEQSATTESSVAVNDQSNGNWNVNQEKTFLGYYPDVRSLYPQAPANAVPAWPKSAYTELKNPPCYEYKNKRGLTVMECPGAQFEPEHVYR